MNILDEKIVQQTIQLNTFKLYIVKIKLLSLCFQDQIFGSNEYLFTDRL